MTLLAFMLGWFTCLAVGLVHVRALHRRHQARERDIRIEERLRAHQLFKEHVARTEQLNATMQLARARFERPT